MEPNDADARGEDLYILPVLLFTTPAKFAPGRIVITAGARGVLTEEDVATALVRHLSGHWGEVPASDREENEFSLQMGFRLLSAYRSRDGVPFWVITEADRSRTTILLPEEY